MCTIEESSREGEKDTNATKEEKNTCGDSTGVWNECIQQESRKWRGRDNSKDFRKGHEETYYFIGADNAAPRNNRPLSKKHITKHVWAGCTGVC